MLLKREKEDGAPSGTDDSTNTFEIITMTIHKSATLKRKHLSGHLFPFNPF